MGSPTPLPMRLSEDTRHSLYSPGIPGDRGGPRFFKLVLATELLGHRSLGELARWHLWGACAIMRPTEHRREAGARSLLSYQGKGSDGEVNGNSYGFHLLVPQNILRSSTRDEAEETEPSQIKLFFEVPEMGDSQGHLPSPQDSLQASALGGGEYKKLPSHKARLRNKRLSGQLPPPGSHGETTVPRGAGTCRGH